MIFYSPNYKSIFVTLQEEEVEFCRDLAEKRCKFKKWGDKANSKNKEWRKGVLNDEDDPSCAERIGLYGEEAFSILTGLLVDETVSEKGDKGWDFLLEDENKKYKLDVKTSKIVYSKKNNYGEFYIKATNDKGTIKTLKSDYYLMASIAHHNGIIINKKGYLSEKDATMIIVELHGFVSKENILKNKKERLGKPVTSNKEAHWKNYYIKKEELIEPIEFLWNYKYIINNKEAGIFV